MTLLVFGAKGQLGKRLVEALSPSHPIVALARAQCDFAAVTQDDIDRLVERHRPTLILNAAAFAMVDDAEKQKDLALRVNAVVPGFLARSAAKHEIKLIQFSTDYVFDGMVGAPYTETAATNPINHYGLTKLQGEHAILEALGDATIFRLQLLYDTLGNSFFCRMRALLEMQTQLKVVADQLSSPTPVAEVVEATARALPKVIAGALSGIYHMACAGHTSRHGFACTIADAMRERHKPCAAHDIVPIVSEEFPSPALRPKDVRLATQKLAAAGIVLPHWRDGLNRVMDAVYASD